MCGIVAGSHLGCDQNKIETALSSIKLRGPDQSRIHFAGSDVFLAFNLLGINSQDSGSLTQPFVNSKGTVSVCVNGEIYNYQELRADLEVLGCKFKTESDCEVVLFGLELYGHSFLSQLDGEFAIVAYFAETNSWLCAVDHVGTKPLKYYVQDYSFAVASSARAISKLGIKLKINLDSSLFAFHNVCLPMGKSLFESIQTIPPGHYLKVHEGQANLHKYSLSKRANEFSIEVAIQRSVQKRIPKFQKLALALSGGIDSSAVALYLKSLQAEFSCFSIDFPHSNYSERKDIEAFCKRNNIATEFVAISESDLLSNFAESVVNAEHLVINPHSAGKLVLNKYIANLGYRVCMTGDGADELFWGYDHFHTAEDFQFVKDSNRIASQYLNIVKPQYHDTLLQKNFFDDFRPSNPTPTEQDLYYNYWFNDYGLKILGDSQAANASVEYRYPFVDPDLLQCTKARGISKQDNFPSKKILRDIIRASDSEAALQPKKPFIAPLMSQNWMPLFEEYVCNEKFKRLDFFDPEKTWEYVSRISEHHLPEGRRASSILLSQILSIAILNQELCDA